MAKLAKFLQGVAGAAGGAGLDITEVFSTYLYDGDGTTSRVITNGIDLSNEGGLVWTKTRSNSLQHTLYDTERGAAEYLGSNETHYSLPQSNSLTSFNSDGFTVGNWLGVNLSGRTYASWTFRKAPKFFDVVTYTGTGSAQNISHDLGSVPGMIIVKQTDVTNNWMVQHRAFGGSHRLQLNSTDAAGTTSSVWNNTDPTSTVFTVGAHTSTNASGGTYVAYLFAHNDGDGEFGPDADADIIKCGSYTGGGSSDVDVNLGFEPQFVIVKGADISRGWVIGDIMRGAPVESNGQRLFANTGDAETTEDTVFTPTPTGFKVKANTGGTVNDSGLEYIYIAIRRGPLAPPESGTEVFDVDLSGSTAPRFESSFPVDMAFWRPTAASNTKIASRLTGKKSLLTNDTSSEDSANANVWDFMDGFYDGGITSNYAWMWKRAPGYFDAVAYEGNGTAGRTVSHNLGVAPEMMWVKRRDNTDIWVVYNETVGNTGFLRLNDTNAVTTAAVAWNDTSPTATDFTLGTYAAVNTSGSDYIAYLFASLEGVSKVGSYSGDGTDGRVVDCGFSSGARFILHKCTSHAGNWFLFDSARGIVAGNDPRLWLNATDAEVTNGDFIDPHSSGFIVNNTYGDLNDTGRDYIFYAIA